MKTRLFHSVCVAALVLLCEADRDVDAAAEIHFEGSSPEGHLLQTTCQSHSDCDDVSEFCAADSFCRICSGCLIDSTSDRYQETIDGTCPCEIQCEFNADCATDEYCQEDKQCSSIHNCCQADDSIEGVCGSEEAIAAECGAQFTCTSHEDCTSENRNDYCNRYGACRDTRECCNRGVDQGNAFDGGCPVCCAEHNFGNACQSHADCNAGCAAEDFEFFPNYCRASETCYDCPHCLAPRDDQEALDGNCPCESQCTSHEECPSGEYCTFLQQCSSTHNCCQSDDGIDGECGTAEEIATSCAQFTCEAHEDCEVGEYCNRFGACRGESECCRRDPPNSFNEVCPICCAEPPSDSACESNEDCNPGCSADDYDFFEYYCTDRNRCSRCGDCLDETIDDALNGDCPCQIECSSHADCIASSGYCSRERKCFAVTDCCRQDGGVDRECPETINCEDLAHCTRHSDCDEYQYCNRLGTCAETSFCVRLDNPIEGEDCPLEDVVDACVDEILRQNPTWCMSVITSSSFEAVAGPAAQATLDQICSSCDLDTAAQEVEALSDACEGFDEVFSTLNTLLRTHPTWVASLCGSDSSCSRAAFLTSYDPSLAARRETLCANVRDGLDDPRTMNSFCDSNCANEVHALVGRRTKPILTWVDLIQNGDEAFDISCADNYSRNIENFGILDVCTRNSDGELCIDRVASANFIHESCPAVVQGEESTVPLPETCPTECLETFEAATDALGCCSTFYVNYMCTSQEARAFVNEECDVASAPQTCERPEGAGVFPEIGQTDVDGEENAARRDTIFELWWMPMLASLFQQARFF